MDDEWNQARRAVKQRQSALAQLQPSQSSLPSTQGWPQQQAQYTPQYGQPSRSNYGQFHMQQASNVQHQYAQQIWGAGAIQPTPAGSMQQAHYFSQAGYYSEPPPTAFPQQMQHAMYQGTIGQGSGAYGYAPSMWGPSYGTASQAYDDPSGIASSASQGYMHQAISVSQQTSAPEAALEQLPPPPQFPAPSQVDGFYTDSEAAGELANIAKCLNDAKSVNRDVSDLHRSIDDLLRSLPTRPSSSLMEQVYTQLDQLKASSMKKNIDRAELKSLEKQLNTFRSRKQTGCIPIAALDAKVQNFLTGCQWKLKCCQIIESNLRIIAQSLRR